MKKLKVAVFGCGQMGTHHIRAIQLHECAEIVAVADLQMNREKLSSILPNETKVFSSPEELLQTVKPDVVHVTTPPASHSDLTKLALKHGAHVYVEKPFAFEANEAKAIISLADEMKLKLCAGHQLLFERPARDAKRFLREIGDIVHVESYFSFRTVSRFPDGRGVLSSVEQLLDILPHPVYVLLEFLHNGADQSQSQTAQLLSLEVKPEGNVHALLRMGEVTGILVVTLLGRPIESYLRLVGTNGSLHADFVHGVATKLAGPGTSGISKVLNPYSQAKQIVAGTTRALAARVFDRQRGYPGLSQLIGAFYESIIEKTPPPLTSQSIIETVSICEVIGKKLREAEVEAERRAEAALKELETKLPSLRCNDCIAVTGGTGFLGRAVVSELRNSGWPVRAIARRIPPPSARIAGVEYAAADLGEKVANKLLDGIVTVVHCAAETAGGKQAHVRNSVNTTCNILDAAARAGIKKFIHISSIAVLKTSRELGGPLDENSPMDLGNISRGPYVWGKAESEYLASKLAGDLGIAIRIIRPGALVDFDAFEAPGKLGREVGPLFIAVGRRRSKTDICDVHVAARVISAYVKDFETAPPVLNLIEPDAPTRTELVSYLLNKRPDLKVVWLHPAVLGVMSPVLNLLQRIIRPGITPIDIQAAFASEEYNSDLAAKMIQQVALVEEKDRRRRKEL